MRRHYCHVQSMTMLCLPQKSGVSTMPIIQIELQLNDKGTATGVRNINAVSDSLDRAKKSASDLGKDGSNSLNTFGKGAEESASRVKGLVTQIIALAGAYKALQAASSFVSRTFNFSSNIESSQIAIASVIGATNKITDGQGRQLEGAEKFNAAQEISATLMEKIQVLALSTTATYDDLVQGVSGIIAPATKAGVAMEKLPQFAVTAAQAMTAMKIPVNQMRTEIESLLSGNINKAQDLLATNLGISGEMVRNWQKQGTLVAELEKRLRVFADAGEATAQTWSGLKSNMQDALDYLSSKTGKGLFEGTKQSYRELLSLLVNTDQNKLGLGDDIKNIAAAMESLENAIGNNLLSVTKELVEKIKEINKPENIDEIKKGFKEFYDTAVDIKDALTFAGNEIYNIVRVSLEGWGQMPQIIKDVGLVGAIAFGWKGKAILAAIGAAKSGLQDLIDNPIRSTSDPDNPIETDYWGNETGYNNRYSKGGRNKPQEEPQQEMVGPQPEIVGPQRYVPTGPFKTTNAIGGFDNKEKGLEKIASAKEQLQKIREEMELFNGESSKANNSLDQKIRQIEKLGKTAGLSASDIRDLQDQYSQSWDTKTLKDLNKELLQAENNTTALQQVENQDKVTSFSNRLNQINSLSQEEKDIMLGRYQTGLSKQVNVKDAQTNLTFIKEFAELSGNNNLSTEYQNQLIAAQADIFRSQLTPELRAMVDEWAKLQQLKNARDPFSGLTRGLRTYSNEASDFAKGFESLTTTAFSNVETSFTTMLTTGQISFTNFANSIINDLARIAVRAAITGPIANGLSSLFGGMFSGSIQTTNPSSSWANFGVTPGASMPLAKGGVLSGGNLSAYSGSIVSSPTFFGYDTHLRAFANGAGLMGEAGPEAILPLKRTSSGDLGVRTDGFGGRGDVQVNIINASGEEVTQRTKTDNYGNKSIDVMIGDAAAKQAMTQGTGMNRAIRAATGARTPVTRR
nr:MAG TPA: minor tail protein [Bacteriophage sp.]